MANSTGGDTTSTAIADVGTDVGLQAVLRQIVNSSDWDGPLGRLVIDQVCRRAKLVARDIRRSCDVSLTDLVDALVGVGWEVLVSQRNDLLVAERPWGVIVKAMSRAASRDARAAELLTSSSSRAGIDGGWHTARRFGLDTATAERGDKASTDPTGDAAVEGDDLDGTGQWDRALRALRDELVDAGAPLPMATEVLATALDIATSTTRRSYVHYTAYRDERLTAMLNREQIRCVIDLLIGSRREGPSGSAWLALREAANSAAPLSLAAAHPQSLNRVRTIAQAWAAPLAAGAELLDRMPA